MISQRAGIVYHCRGSSRLGADREEETLPGREYDVDNKERAEVPGYGLPATFREPRPGISNNAGSGMS